MNEHINQCWEEAAKAFTGDTWAEQTDFLERFAQLIVKECAYLVNIQQRTTGYTNHAEMLCKQFNIEFREEDYYENI